ncbi:hypothetical protein GDO78_021875 [Eleutherodactylus coqui]|uniref:Starch-binding domain-containing protein 1 n=1 Tax=Eleutherodactylus coqui TaxID=57060 RepID=A0A8J6JS77_ELECQ|nr:hypothetical protein GDO78_021875 [Eleutherodactylus coqui]
MVAELSQQTKAEDGCQPNSHEVKVTPNGVPEARDLHHEEQECPPLTNEVEAPPAGDEVVRPPSMSGEHGAHKLPQDSVEAGQREELLSWRNGGQDEANGNAAGSQLENSFDAKEKAVGLLKAKENLNQDLYLEMVNTLDEAGSDTRADQMMKPEEVEKCELVSLMSPICLQDSAALGDEMMSDAQKLGTGPESSPVDTCNLVNQEKEIAGLGNSSTDDKTALDKSSETNIQDLDNQKTRKIATIQPMPQNVNIALKVHYITQSDAQVIAVTGDHEKLGKWEAYVPLTSGKDGLWSHLITLPVDTNLAWKLVMVENGKIKRWEECNNRFLKTTHEDIAIQLCWGFP